MLQVACKRKIDELDCTLDCVPEYPFKKYKIIISNFRKRKTNDCALDCVPKHPFKKHKIVHNNSRKSKTNNTKKIKQELPKQKYICVIHKCRYICNIYDCCGVKTAIPEDKGIPSYIC